MSPRWHAITSWKIPVVNAPKTGCKTNRMSISMCLARGRNSLPARNGHHGKHKDLHRSPAWPSRKAWVSMQDLDNQTRCSPPALTIRLPECSGMPRAGIGKLPAQSVIGEFEPVWPQVPLRKPSSIRSDIAPIIGISTIKATSRTCHCRGSA